MRVFLSLARLPPRPLRASTSCARRSRYSRTQDLGGPLRSASTGNDYRYDDVRDLEIRVPDRFNFAQDVLDAHAAEEATRDGLALHHVAEGGSGSEEETRWTYAQLSDLSRRAASALRKMGDIRRAVIVLPKVPEWWLLNAAALRTGTVLLPGTTLLSSSDLSARLEASGADAVIADAATTEKVDVALKGKKKALEGRVRHKILVGEGEKAEAQNGWVRFGDLMDGAEPIGDRQTDSSEVVQIFFTSGTTGAPKMVPHTQASYGYCHQLTGRYWLDLTPGDVHWNISDTGWAKSAWSNVFAPWSQGACVFVHGMARFAPSEVLRVLGDYPVTTLCAPPTLYRSLVQEDLSSRRFPKLRHCVSAGEPLNQEVIASWEAQTGHRIKEGYGQTETTLITANFKGEEKKNQRVVLSTV